MDAPDRRPYHFLTREDINRRIQNMRATGYEVMPLYLFLELAGTHRRDFQDVFVYKTRPMTNLEQKRYSRALILMENGEVRATMNFGKMRAELKFTKEPQPRLGRKVLLTYNPSEGFKVKPSIYNKQAFNLPRLLDKGTVK